MLAVDGSWVDALGRWLIVIAFAVAGISNLTRARIKDHIDRMALYNTPFPTAVFWIGITMQLTGCLLLATGWQPRLGAWLLILFTILATAIFHRFWQMTDPLKRNISRLMVISNTAITGGLLLLLHNTL